VLERVSDVPPSIEQLITLGHRDLSIRASEGSR
jgi:hypothetical protein